MNKQLIIELAQIIAKEFATTFAKEIIFFIKNRHNKD